MAGAHHGLQTEILNALGSFLAGMSWQHSTKMEGAPIDEAPASGQEPVGAPHEENPPHNDDNPVTKLFKDMGTKVKNVVAAVERMEER